MKTKMTSRLSRAAVSTLPPVRPNAKLFSLNSALVISPKFLYTKLISKIVKITVLQRLLQSPRTKKETLFTLLPIKKSKEGRQERRRGKGRIRLRDREEVGRIELERERVGREGVVESLPVSFETGASCPK